MTIEIFFIAFVSLAFLGMLSWGISIHFSRKGRVPKDSLKEAKQFEVGFGGEANLPSSESSFSGPALETGPISGPTTQTMSNHALRNNALRGTGVVQASGPVETGPTGPTGPTK
jgi:hypothetical protein